MDTAMIASTEATDGNAFVGFLILLGIVWLICAACKPKPKGYDIQSHTKASITPRR